MIKWLKEAQGHEYTAKLQQMFNDIRVSEDTNRDFQAYLQNRYCLVGR
jgi:cullin family protein